MNRRIVLASRPAGRPELTNFRMEEVPAPQLAAGQILLRTMYLSLDPYMRGGSIYLVGGWRVSSVMLMQSGFPLGVNQTPNTTNLNGAGQRPNLTGGANPLLPGQITNRLRDDPNDNLYLNPGAFALAPAFTFGDAPRILPGVRSVGRFSTDIALDKELHTGGGTRATLRIEVINLFNTPWYTSLASTNFGAANFGQVTTQANLSRFSQITARFDW